MRQRQAGRATRGATSYAERLCSIGPVVIAKKEETWNLSTENETRGSPLRKARTAQLRARKTRTGEENKIKSYQNICVSSSRHISVVPVWL